MPKTLIQSVITQLRKEQYRLEHELRRVTAALTAFGKLFIKGSTAEKTNDLGCWTPEDRRSAAGTTVGVGL